MAFVLADPEVKEYVTRLREIAFAYGKFQDDDELKDYIKCLLLKECARKFYHARSPQRSIRVYLIKYLMKVAVQASLCYSTVSSAIYMYNRFTDYHSISRKQIHLVALTCLIIAGKMEERDATCPKIKRLKFFLPTDSDFSYKLFQQIELCIIGYFKWDILIPTTYTFLECFILYSLDGTGLLAQQDCNNNEPLSGVKLEGENDQIKCGRSISDYSLYVLHYILEAEPNDYYPPSCVAASILMYSRRRFGYNFWTQRLSEITGCTYGQMMDCLRNFVNNKVPYTLVNGPLIDPCLAC